MTYFDLCSIGNHLKSTHEYVATNNRDENPLGICWGNAKFFYFISVAAFSLAILTRVMSEEALALIRSSWAF